MRRLSLLLAIAAASACGGDGDDAADAGMDAQKRLALTVEGPTSLAGTRSVTVTITANGSTRNDSFPVGGLPATVDLPQPIQLGTWMIRVDGFDMNATLTGRGMASVAAGTSQTTVTLAPI